MKGAIAVVAAGVALVLLLAIGAVSSSAAAGNGCLPSGVEVAGAIPASLGLDAEQRANATAIVGAVVSRRLPSRAAVIAVATAMQESSLRNLPFGDADSVGLFQQRPSAGWGTPTQLIDPAFAADRFLARLVKVPRWQVRPLTQVAQDVQRSGHPDAYARWETAASGVVASLLARPAPEAADPGDVSDLPGLAVYGDKAVRAFGGPLPTSYLGGPVTVDIAPDLTAGRLAADVARDARHTKVPGTTFPGTPFPGTVVIGVHSDPEARPPRHLDGQVLAALRQLGRERTIFWLTEPGPAGDELTAVLTRLASSAPGLHLTTPTELLDDLGLADVPDPTASAVPGCDDGLGGYGAVAVADCTFILAKANPRSCQDAMRWALAQVDGPPVWYRRCLNFTARAYGYTVSGVENAALYWATASDPHPGDVNPPAGSLAFWDTGHEDGHVALSLGDGLVVSNDVNGRGTIAVLPLEELTRRWSARYLGWAPPFFPHGS